MIPTPRGRWNWQPPFRPIRTSFARRDTDAPAQWVSVDWDEVSLVLWQSPLPAVGAADSAGAALQNVVDRGGQVIFFPPDSPTDDSFAALAVDRLAIGRPAVPGRQLGQ